MPQLAAQTQDPPSLQLLGKDDMSIIQDYYSESVPSDLAYESMGTHSQGSSAASSSALQVPGYNTMNYAQLTGVGESSPSSFLGGIALPLPPMGDDLMADIDWVRRSSYQWRGFLLFVGLGFPQLH